jgi:VWFA-related protein
MSLSRSACLTLIICLPVFCWAGQNPAPAAAAGQHEVASPSAPVLPPLASANAEGRIHLDVVVTSKSGMPVSGLALNGFTLLDNNQPGRILSFHAFDGTVQKAAPPTEVILVLDTVNLSFPQVSIARQQIANFLLQNGGHLAQPVSLFVLTNQGLDLQRRPTRDGNELAAEIKQLDNQLRAVNQSAGLWGAIERYQFSVQTMMIIAEDEAKKPGRKLLLWVGPGWPQFDSAALNSTFKDQQQDFDVIVQLSTRLREARTSVYSVSSGQPDLFTFLYRSFLNGVKTAANADPPDFSVKVLAVQSGGRVLGPDNDMTAQINDCIQDAGAFYTLSFDPPRAVHANEYHDLKVLVARPGLAARTSTGYYNQP